MARAWRSALILPIALIVLALASPRPGLALGTITMTGTVSNPVTLTVPNNATAVQSLTGTRYDLNVGTIASGQSWSGATLSLYLSHGHHAAVPSVSITDSSGATLSAIATGTIVSENGAATGVVNYQIGSDLPANAVLHFTGFALFGLDDLTSGTEIQVIAVANGSASSFRQYANWQTIATIGAGRSSSITPQSGWWWSSAEPGRGYALEAENGHLMLAAYMYRADGTSVWYVASGAMSGADFTAPLYEYSGGGTLAGSPHAASQLGAVATVTVSFSSATQATIHWGGSVFGSTAPTSTITRFSFTSSSSVTPPATSAAPQTGWYWNASETGTGWFVEMQGSQIFLATYMYAADGSARWYVAQGTPSSTSGVFGSTSGLALTAALSEYAGGETLTSGPRNGLTQLAQGQLTVLFTSTTATVTLPNGRQLQLSRFTQF